jgi:hypothetical protein
LIANKKMNGQPHLLAIRGKVWMELKTCYEVLS